METGWRSKQIIVLSFHQCEALGEGVEMTKTEPTHLGWVGGLTFAYGVHVHARTHVIA